MGIVFTDGMDNYLIDADMDESQYAFFHSNAYVETALGRYGGGALGYTGTPLTWLSIDIDDPIGFAATKGFLSFSVKVESTANGELVGFFNAGHENRDMCALTLNSGGLALTRHTTSVAAATSGLTSDVWHRIEIRFVLHNTTGEFEVKVDGATVIDFTGDTLYTGVVEGCSRISFGSDDTLIDDIVVHNDQGDEPTDFIGDMRIKTVRPSSDGDSLDSVVTGSANRFSAVNEQASDGDTSYISLDALGDLDLYNFGDVTGTPTVHAVVVKAHARTDSSTFRTLKGAAKVGGTEYTGAESIIASGLVFGTMGTAFSLNPDTGLAWTAAQIDAAQFGYEMAN